MCKAAGPCRFLKAELLPELAPIFDFIFHCQAFITACKAVNEDGFQCFWKSLLFFRSRSYPAYRSAPKGDSVVHFIKLVKIG